MGRLLSTFLRGGNRASTLGEVEGMGWASHRLCEENMPPGWRTDFQGGMQLLVVFFPRQIYRFSSLYRNLSVLWTKDNDHQQWGLCVNSTDSVGLGDHGAFDVFIVSSHSPNTSPMEAADESARGLDWSERDKILCRRIPKAQFLHLHFGWFSISHLVTVFRVTPSCLGDLRACSSYHITAELHSTGLDFNPSRLCDTCCFPTGWIWRRSWPQLQGTYHSASLLAGLALGMFYFLDLGLLR